MRGTLLLVTCLVASTYSKAVNKTKECSWNTDCPDNFLCNKSECLDPCSDLCGSGAFCEVLPDTTRCSCSKGLFGDPYVKCGPEEDCKDTVEQKPIVDRCRGACPPSARCILGKELNCICMEGTTGNPFIFCLPPQKGIPVGLGNFGVGLVTIASVICAATVYLAVDACSNICYQKETTSFKINACAVLSVYPIAGLCSLTALALPRSQLLAEALTQASLTISLYRLYLLLLELGQRRMTKAPPLALRVGPCCCWPCLPLPSLEMTAANLSWLRATVLQLPIVQGLVYCVLLFMSAEAPVFAISYGVFLQPIVVASILLGIYGLTVVTKSLQEIQPEAKLHQKTMVSQMVLLFSKLQGFVIKGLVRTGLFPCNPPLTPHVYANVTYDALMVIEMLLLCYAARLIYAADGDPAERRPDKRPSVTATPPAEPAAATAVRIPVQRTADS